MGKESSAHAETGPAWVKKMRKITVSGGPLKGACYGNLPEVEIAKSAKAYRGDPRFMQYCRQFMASKLIDGAEEPDSKSDSSSSGKLDRKWVSEWGIWLCTGAIRWVQKSSKFKLAFLIFMLLFVCSRPNFSVLCGKVTVLMVKTVFRRSVALVTMVLDTILDEAIQQVDSALSPAAVAVQTLYNDQLPIDGQSNSFHMVMHLICLVMGSILGRNYGQAPWAARNL
jgi:hypothetical protein